VTDVRDAIDSLVEVPPVVQHWMRQLLDPAFLAMLRAYPADQVDVRLSASRGRVRRAPVIVFNGGPQSLD